MFYFVKKIKIAIFYKILRKLKFLKVKILAKFVIVLTVKV